MFFFFKQKTAYEMRISDWSSDVCSSDPLEQLERFTLVFLLGLLLRITAQMNALAQIIHAREVFLPDLVKHGQHHVLFQMAHHFAADLRLFAGKMRRCAFNAKAGNAIGIKFIVRKSDEHTSDLKSLIRTSTAIFSLNTKK